MTTLTPAAGAPAFPNFALTFSRNTSTSAAWSGQNLARGNANIHSGKPCCGQPAESRSVLGSCYESSEELRVLGTGEGPHTPGSTARTLYPSLLRFLVLIFLGVLLFQHKPSEAEGRVTM